MRTARRHPLANSSPKGRILIVDDDELDCEAISTFLRYKGFEVTEATSGTKALALLREKGKGFFDAVITDYMMPGMNGGEFYGSVLQSDACLAGVVITAAREKEITQKCLRAGFTDIVEKPFDLQQLKASVEKAVAATREQRDLQRMAGNVGEVEQMRPWKPGYNQVALPLPLEMIYFPKSQVGGSLVSLCKNPRNQVVLMVASVDAPGLKSAYISAFFQGMFRGLVELGTPLGEILQKLHQFLHEEWTPKPEASVAGVPEIKGMCCCALEYDFSDHHLSLYCQGFPSPLLLDHPEAAQWTCVPPAGLMHPGEATPIKEHLRFLNEGGAIYIWSNEFENLAKGQNVSPLSLLYSLLEERQGAAASRMTQPRSGDLLGLVVELRKGTDRTQREQPILWEAYSAYWTGQVENLVRYWKNSLLLAFPRIKESFLESLLSEVRQAWFVKINDAQIQREDGMFQLQISWSAAQQKIFVTLKDLPRDEYSPVRRPMRLEFPVTWDREWHPDGLPKHTGTSTPARQQSRG